MTGSTCRVATAPPTAFGIPHLSPGVGLLETRRRVLGANLVLSRLSLWLEGGQSFTALESWLAQG